MELMFSQLKNINRRRIADWREENVGGDGLSENHRKHLCPLHCAALTGRGLQCDVDLYCASVQSWDKGVYTQLVKAHSNGTAVCCLACEVNRPDVIVDVWLFACDVVIHKENTIATN